MVFKVKRIAAALFILATQSAYAFENKNTAIEETSKFDSTGQNARLAALREYAIAKGIAEGRQKQFIYRKTEQASRKNELDKIYQVDDLYLRPTKVVETKTTSNGITRKEVEDPAYRGFLIQPPVILTGTDLVQLENKGREINWSELRYEIATSAQMVTSPIYWGTFLINDEDMVKQGPADDPVLKARNSEEQQVMDNFYKIALEEGKSQAENEIVSRIKTLTTIIVGMRNYHILSKKGIVEKAQVATGYVPISGNKTQLTMSTFNARIAKDAQFNLDPSSYKTFIQRK